MQNQGRYPSATADTPTLYKQAAAGDKQAEAQLIAIVTPKLRKQLQRNIWEKDVLEDIQQETLLAFIIKIRKNAISTPESLVAYVCAIGRYIAYQYIKKHRNDLEHLQTYDPDWFDSHAGDSSQCPDTHLEQQQTEQFVHDMMCGLNQPRDKDILVSYYFDEQDSDVICKNHNLHQDHLYRVMFRARQRLGKLIDKQPNDRSDWF